MIKLQINKMEDMLYGKRRAVCNEQLEGTGSE